jgi:hypothetical protein
MNKQGDIAKNMFDAPDASWDDNPGLKQPISRAFDDRRSSMCQRSGFWFMLCGHPIFLEKHV